MYAAFPVGVGKRGSLGEGLAEGCGVGAECFEAKFAEVRAMAGAWPSDRPGWHPSDGTRVLRHERMKLAAHLYLVGHQLEIVAVRRSLGQLTMRSD